MGANPSDARSPSPILPLNILGVETMLGDDFFDDDFHLMNRYLKTTPGAQVPQNQLQVKKKRNVPVEEIRQFMQACSQAKDWDSIIELTKESSADQLHEIISCMSSLGISSRSFSFRFGLKYAAKDDPQVRQVLMHLLTSTSSWI